MANHTYYLLPITYYLSLCSLFLLTKGTGGQGDKYILSPPPLEKEYIYLPIIILVIQSYIKILCLCAVNLCSPPLNLCLPPVNITFHVEKIHFFP